MLSGVLRVTKCCYRHLPKPPRVNDLAIGVHAPNAVDSSKDILNVSCDPKTGFFFI